MFWSVKEVVQWLECPRDVAALRAASLECREACDATVIRLRPLVLPLPLLSALPSLKELHLTHEQLRLWHLPQLAACSALSKLTLLHLGGPACAQLRTQHVSWIGALTNLQALRLQSCSRVHLSVLSAWHGLRQLRSLALIGLATTTVLVQPHVAAFIKAGPGANLTSLVLGDQHGLSFLGDGTLQDLGTILQPHRPALRVLDLSGCIELTDAGTAHLAGLHASLQQLHLHNTLKLSVGTARVIGRLTGLTALNLRGCSQWTDTHLAQMLGGLSGLQQLSLRACSSVCGAFLQAVGSRLASLRVLDLSHCSSLQANSLRWLQALPQLQQLGLTGCAAVSSAEALAALGALPGLTELQGGQWRLRAPLPGDGGAHAAGAGTSVGSSQGGGGSSGSSVACGSGGGAAQAGLRTLLPPNLLRLQLPELSCSGAWFACLLQHLPATLTTLDLSQCYVSGEGGLLPGASLQALGRLQQLRELDLSCVRGSWQPASELVHLSALGVLTRLAVDCVEAAAASEAGGGGCDAAGVGALASGVRGSQAEASCGSGGSASTCSSASSASTSASASSSSSSTRSSSMSTSASAEAGSSSSTAHWQGMLQALSSADAQAAAAQQAAAGAGAVCADSTQQAAGVCALMRAPGHVCTSGGGSRGTGRMQGSHGRVSRLLFADAPAVSSAALDGMVAAAMAALSLGGGRDPTPAAAPAGAAADADADAAAAEAAARGAPAQDCGPCSSAGDDGPRDDDTQRQPQASTWLAALTPLQDLRVRHSPWVCDGVVASLGSLSQLSRLELVSSKGLRGWSLGALCALTALQALDLTGCGGLRDEGLAALVAAAAPVRQLRTLLLPGCGLLTDASLTQLCALTSLRTLDLSYNRAMSSRALAALAPALPLLHTLHLAVCLGLCDDALVHLVRAPSLADLNLRGCWRLSDEGVFALLSASTSLMCVNLDNCSRLSMACCPGHFTVADEAAAIRSGLGLHAARPPSYARPPALVRMPC